jgi:general secretion pathway protein D
MNINATSARRAAQRGALALALAALLAGCAAERAYRSGLEGLEEGRYEQGIASLEEAVKHEPDNAEFRSGLRTGREQSVRLLTLEAERHLGAGRLDAAEKAFQRVRAIEPDNARAASGVEAIARARRHAPLMEQAQKLFQQKEYNVALGKARQVLAENPNHAEAVAMQARIEELQMRDAHAPLKLKSRYVKPVTLQFRDANIRMVFEALSKTTGINFIFDNDVKNGVKVTIFVNQVSVEDAIDLILAQSGLAQKILNDNTVLIYPATAAKHKEYQEQLIKSFYLTNIEPKKAQTLLKTMLDAGTVFIDEKASLLVLRDTPEVIRMAEKLFAAADVAEPEVMLEVEVLEVKRSTLQQLGISYPGNVSFSLVNRAGKAEGLTMKDLRDLGDSNVAVTPLSVGVDITKQDSDTKVLASPRIRARSKEKARIHIGDRVPVITNAVTPLSTGAQTVTGSVQYLDVGLKLEIEPAVHLDNDVAIKMNLEVSSIVKEVINTVSGTVAYQIGTRNASTLLRLHDGETQVLAGLINDEERTTANKVPGLGDLPILGRLFSTQKDDNVKTEIVLSITPRLIRNIARPDAATTEFWYGSEARKRGKPLTIQSVGRGEPLAPAGVPVPAAPPAQPIEPATPTPEVQGQAAPAAEPVLPVPLVLEGPDRVTVGEEFEVALTMKPERPVNGVALQIGYEPAVFEVVAVAEGAFVRESGAEGRFSHQVNNTTGRIEVRVAPGEGEGFTGAADVVKVTFRAIGAKARTQVAVYGVNLTGAEGRRLTAQTAAPLVVASSTH